MLTDNEIIKALERCAKSKCKECSFNRHYDTKRTLCTLRLSEHALELIEHQKAKIDELNHDVEVLYRVKEQLKDMYKTAKTEAIKEFAVRLKENYNVIFGRKAVSIADINSLVKEMTEG